MDRIESDRYQTFLAVKDRIRLILKNKPKERLKRRYRLLNNSRVTYFNDNRYAELQVIKEIIGLL